MRMRMRIHTELRGREPTLECGGTAIGAGLESGSSSSSSSNGGVGSVHDVAAVISLNLGHNKLRSSGAAALAQLLVHQGAYSLSSRYTGSSSSSSSSNHRQRAPHNSPSGQPTTISANNSMLTALDLRYNSVGNDGAEAIARALGHAGWYGSKHEWGRTRRKAKVGEVTGATAAAANDFLPAGPSPSAITADPTVSDKASERESIHTWLGWDKDDKMTWGLHTHDQVGGGSGGSGGCDCGGGGGGSGSANSGTRRTGGRGSRGNTAPFRPTRKRMWSHAKCCLTSLNIDGNKITQKGADAIAQAMQVNGTLTDLSLKHNKIGGRGLRALTHASATSISLTALDVSYCSLKEQEMRFTLATLQTNWVLEKAVVW